MKLTKHRDTFNLQLNKLELKVLAGLIAEKTLKDSSLVYHQMFDDITYLQRAAEAYDKYLEEEILRVDML